MNMKVHKGRVTPLYRLKKLVVGIALLSFGATIEKVSKKSPELKAELKDWPEGLVFALGVLPNGPAITMKHAGGVIRYLGRGYKEDPALKVLFKNVDSAFLPFTGQMGSHTAFIQHRAILHGSVVDGIKMSRAMGIVQCFLLPGIVLKRIFKTPPRLAPKQMILKAEVYATMGIGMALNAFK